MGRVGCILHGKKVKLLILFLDYLHLHILKICAVSKRRKNNALLVASIKYFKWPILAGLIPRFAQIGFFFAQPYLVGRTTVYISDPFGTKNEGYGLIGAFAFVYVGLAVSS